MPTALAKPTAYRSRTNRSRTNRSRTNRSRLEPRAPKPAALDQDLPPRPVTRQLPVRNRLRVLLVHIPAFSIQGQARLAHDAGVARSTVSRLVNGQISPSYRLAHAVTDALERKRGHPLDIREVFTLDGTYPTPSGCALCGCQGCLPQDAWGEDDALKPEWKDARPGDWSLARPPQVSADLPESRTRPSQATASSPQATASSSQEVAGRKEAR